MIKGLRFNHIGVAVSDMVETQQIYTKLGYNVSEIIYDPIQKVNICFVKSFAEPDIELIQPVSPASPVSSILKKNGNIPYHLCYSTKDIEKSIGQLRELKFIAVGPIVEANALNNQKICFLYQRNYGLIELVQIKGG
jgi:methylmalonyl-CoA/ethylmalonyl-CoA epimerase